MIIGMRQSYKYFLVKAILCSTVYAAFMLKGTFRLDTICCKFGVDFVNAEIDNFLSLSRNNATGHQRSLQIV